MPLYRLGSELVFPHPSLAHREGLLAAGGDLSPERLLLAYCNGIFPWFNEGDPILWWSPDPRCIIYPNDIRVSGSMTKFLRKTCFKVMFDTAFRQVINLCAEVRFGNTWITREMKESYIRLHELGFAHSVEVYDGGELVGGLYGVSVGHCFFGESMFSLKDNASKTALITLCRKLSEFGFAMVDCQVSSVHLESMGAVNIPRQEFLELLEQGLCGETIRGSWAGVFTD